MRKKIIAAIVVATCNILFFSGSVHAEPVVIRAQSRMKGRIAALEKTTAFLTVGDYVVLILNEPLSLFLGDRMEIYEPVKTGRIDETGSPILSHVGRLVITDVGESGIVGMVEFASREIMAGSFVDEWSPEKADDVALLPLIGSILEMHRPGNVSGAVRIAFAGATNSEGEITGLSEAIGERISASLCARPQFSCVGREDIGEFMREFGIPTIFRPGKYFLKRMGARLGTDLLITATVDGSTAEARVVFEIYSWKTGAWDPEVNITLRNIEGMTASSERDVLVRKGESGIGFLKIVLNRAKKLKGKRVDHLFVEKAEFPAVPDQPEFGDGVGYGAAIDLDGKPLSLSKKDGQYYSDFVRSGAHLLTVSFTHPVSGRGQNGERASFSRTVTLEIPPDTGTETEVDVRLIGGQVIIAVDSNPLEEGPFPVDR